MIEILDKTTCKGILYNDLATGATFKFGDDLFIKTDIKQFALRVSSGCQEEFSEQAIVLPVVIKIYITKVKCDK